MELNELLSIKAGTILQKGTRKRIFIGTDGMYVYYKTPSGRGTIGGNFLSLCQVVKGSRGCN